MLLNEYKLIEIFCSVDDFCKVYEEKLLPHLLPSTTSKKTVNTPSISLSEMVVIELLYHLSGHKCFQYYYEMEVLKGSLHSYFPKAPSYNRFVELKPRMLMALIAYFHLCRVGLMLQLYYADSTVLAVCHNRRIHQHKVFAGGARRGKTSTGWFFGFKLFIVINAYGEFIRAFIIPANQADNSEKTIRRFFKGLTGFIYADKGFTNQNMVAEFINKGLRIVTGIRTNMKNKLVEMKHKLLLKKRGVIESVTDILKTICDIEHTRHRSPVNMLVNTYAALVAYTWLERKPNIFTFR